MIISNQVLHSLEKVCRKGTLAQLRGSVPERNFGIFISNQLLHSFEEVCRKGRPGVGYGCRVVLANMIREKRGDFHSRMHIIIYPETG